MFSGPMKVNSLFISLIREQFWPLLVLFGATAFIGITLQDMAAGLFTDQEGLRILLHLMIGLTDLGEGLLLMLFLSWAVARVHPFKGPRFLNRPFDRPYLSSFFAEYLRALASTLIWALFLLIPGFIRYLQLTFVPFIVFFSADYEKGEVDALKFSTSLFKKCWVPVSAVIIGTTLLSMTLEMVPFFYGGIFHSIPIRVTFQLLNYLLAIWTYSFIVLLFEREMKRIQENP